MKPYGRLFAIAVALFMVLSAAAVMSSARAAEKCDCPKDDPATHGRVQVLVNKELSSAEAIPTSNSLGYPKTLTVCMTYDQTNKGYPADVKLVVEGSLDGRSWFPSTLAGSDIRAESINGCLSVTPTQYVRVGWPPAANILSPGPRVTVQVQAGY